MKRQIIAKINNIANELDRNGLYAEASALTNVMKKLAFDPTNPMNSETFGPQNDDPDEGKIIVSPSEDKDNPYQSKYTIYIFIDGKFEEDFNYYEDENGKHLLNDLSVANEMADLLKAENEERYPGVEFEVHKLQTRTPDRRIPGDPYDAYKDSRDY
jgi:hypothetical protein